jgi:nitroreductase
LQVFSIKPLGEPIVDLLPNDVLRRVLEAATWAPTGGNRQAWQVIVVKDPVRKQRLGELYKKLAVPFIQSYAERFTSLPEAERVKAEKMLRSGLFGLSTLVRLQCCVSSVFTRMD